MKDPGGIVIGQDARDGSLLIDRSQKHFRFIGPTGTGKTTSYFMPTLSSAWRGSFVAHLRMMDLYLLLQSSRKWRHNLLFAPTERWSIRYNPFAEVRRGDKAVSDCQNMAMNLLPSGSINAKEPIWDTNSLPLVTAQMLFLLNFEDDHRKNFAGLIDLHNEGAGGWARMMRNQHPDPWVRRFIAAEAHKLARNENERYVESIIATINSYYQPFNNPVIADVTSESEFRIADLVCGPHPVGLFLYLPPDDSNRLAPLARIIISQILNRLMSDERTDGQRSLDGLIRQHYMLFPLDEYNRLGKLKVIDDAFADMRGFGCRVMIGAQSDGVLMTNDMYGPASLTVSQSRLVAMRPDSDVEAKRISAMLPVIKEKRHSGGDTFGDLGERKGMSVSQSVVERPLLRPDEILRLPIDKAIIPGFDKPLMVDRPSWDHWMPLCEPKPRAMSPQIDVEMLPVRADGKYLDLPSQMVPRNAWFGIKHPIAAPPAEPEPEPEEAPSPTMGVGLKGKLFDWKTERENVKPRQRTSVYVEAIGPKQETKPVDAISDETAQPDTEEAFIL